MTELTNLIEDKCGLGIKEEIDFLKSNKKDGFYFKDEETTIFIFKSKNLIVEGFVHYMTGENFCYYDLDEYIKLLEEALKEDGDY